MTCQLSIMHSDRAEAPEDAPLTGEYTRAIPDLGAQVTGLVLGGGAFGTVTRWSEAEPFVREYLARVGASG